LCTAFFGLSFSSFEFPSFRWAQEEFGTRESILSTGPFYFSRSSQIALPCNALISRWNAGACPCFPPRLFFLAPSPSYFSMWSLFFVFLLCRGCPGPAGKGIHVFPPDLSGPVATFLKRAAGSRSSNLGPHKIPVMNAVQHSLEVG